MIKVFRVFLCLTISVMVVGVNVTFACVAGPSVGVGDFVWNDLNLNGIQDAGEPGIAGVQVNLWEVVNNTPTTLIITTLTDASGLYHYNGLKPNPQIYALQFTSLPLGTTFTHRYQGGDPTKDSNANLSGFTENFTLANGAENLTFDAGIIPIPLPGTALLLGSSLLGLIGLRRFRKS
jgi:hypothetical protein